jgi:hypothetical protein
MRTRTYFKSSNIIIKFSFQEVNKESLIKNAQKYKIKMLQAGLDSACSQTVIVLAP